MSAKLLTHRETAYICRSLAGLLHAGIDLGESCYLLSQEDSGNVSSVLSQLGKLLDAGSPFADAMAQLQCFPSSSSGLIRTGEVSGRLEEALLAAAQFHETRERTRKQLKNAVGYPLILLGLMLTVVIVLLVQVLPVFDSVYVSLGTRLTGISAGLLQLGQWLKGSLPLFVGIPLILAAATVCYGLFPRFRNAVTQPFDDRGIHREFNNALFVQSLAMGIHSGLTPEASMELAAQLFTDSPAAASRCEAALKQIHQGNDLSEVLRASGLMPAYGCRMLSVGLRGGNADQILNDIAVRMQEDAEQTLQDRISKIEPALVLSASIAVGLILLSVMLPLMNMMAALG